MLELLKTYVDAIDSDAYEKAESGETIFPKADWPIAPLLAPWVVGGPALALLTNNGTIEAIIFVTALTVSIGGYLWCAAFYERLVQKYRVQLGTFDK